MIEKGHIALLANLPNLKKLTISYFDLESDEILKYFTSLKSLELLYCKNISNATLTYIAKYCLELQILSIRRKFLIVNF